MEEYLLIGEVSRPQGLRGELKIKPYTDDPQRFMVLTRVHIEGKALAIHPVRVHEGAAYVRLEGIYTREAAEAMRGKLLYVHRDNAVTLPEDTEFICDLIGCCATDTDGVDHGTLCEVLPSAGTDVYVFSGPRGQLMVPALRAVILQVDVRAKRILLDAARLAETSLYA